MPRADPNSNPSGASRIKRVGGTIATDGGAG